ncbi:MAG: methyl-accepting chemotaxis protein [Anaerolineae bacterium]|nr:methyl-accepting chemotaxis protein [Anaerolineae bacterium]
MTVAENKSPQPVRLTLWQRFTGSITTSFLLAFVLTLFLALAGTLLLRYRDSLADVERQESRLANLLAQSLNAHIRQHAELAQTLATAISLDERIQGAFSNQDRESLLQISQTYWQALSLSYPVAQFHFHLPPSTSFLRVHQPDKYGDSLADRPMVVEAIANRKPIAGVEWGRAGLSIRGIAPVFYLDRFIGTVEIGIAFTDQLLRDLNFSDKEVPYRIRILAVDLARLRAGDPNSLTPIAASEYYQPAIDLDLYRTMAESGIPQHTYTTVGGRRYYVYLYPVKDFAGQVAAVAEILMDHAALLEPIRRSMISDIILRAVLLVGVSLLVWLMLRVYIRRPLRKLAEAMQAIAGGDLHHSLDIGSRRDELGLMAQAFSKLQEYLSHTLSQLDQMAQRLAASSEELANAMESVGMSSQQISSTVADIAAGAGKQAEETSTIATSMGEIRQLSQDIAERANQSVVQTHAMAQAIQGTSTALQQLGERSDIIRRTVAMMAKFADETHLLALNAAVEAARAGAAGRGFAVLADEIRQLARSSAQATEEVTEQSQHILKAIEQLLAGMPTALAQVQEIASLSERIALATQHQNERIAKVSQALSEISSIAEQNAAGTEQLAAAIEEQNVSLEELVVLSQELTQMAAELRSSVDQIYSGSAAEEVLPTPVAETATA